MNYFNEFKFAKKLMKEVYKKVLMHPIESVVEKADSTLVTDIDIAVEDYLVSGISKKYPMDRFITEERNPDNQAIGRTWVIDPIDGTVCFIKGLPTWGIQLAFVDNDVTQFSIIYLPKLNEMHTCFRGRGYEVNGKKLPPLKDNNINECVTEYCGRIGVKTNLIWARLYQSVNDVAKNQFAFGSACSSFVNVATGRCDAMISGCKAPWDIYAGEFMLEERGVNIYKSKLGVSIYSSSTELFKKLKAELKEIEKKN